MDHFEDFKTDSYKDVWVTLIPGVSAHHICPNCINLTRWGEIRLKPTTLEESLKFTQSIENLTSKLREQKHQLLYYVFHN